MQIPKELNGKPVVHAVAHENGIATLMMQGDGEIIVATWWPELGASWSWGHYHRGSHVILEAGLDFDETCKRNEARS
jgi:hypothetical protein